MEPQAQIICPNCHAANPATAYFCSNCGKTLKEKLASVSFGMQCAVYFVSIFLPPLGFWYAFKYWKQSGDQARRIAVIAAILTAASTIIATWYTVALLGTIMQSFNEINALASPNG